MNCQRCRHVIAFLRHFVRFLSCNLIKLEKMIETENIYHLQKSAKTERKLTVNRICALEIYQYGFLHFHDTELCVVFYR